MPKLTFTHPGQAPVTHEAPVGQSILDIAINHDVPLQHACGGFCACTTCHVQVKEGMENLSPVDEDEAERLEGVDHRTPNSRLGCQAKLVKPAGDVTVEIVNLDY